MKQLAEYLTTTPTGVPLVHGSATHLTALAVVALCVVAVILGRRPIAASARPTFGFVLAAVLIANEVAWHLWVWRAGDWRVETMLPLHACSAVIWISGIMLVTRSYRLCEIVLLVGVSGALQALATPSVGEFGFPHFRYFQFFIAHGGIVVVATYMCAVEGFRPEPRSLLRAAGVVVAYTLLVGAVNAALGSNYLFIAHKPPENTALDLLPAWPWYIVPMVLGFFTSMVLLYLPFHVFRRREGLDR